MAVRPLRRRRIVCGSAPNIGRGLLLGDSTFGGADLVATYAQQGGWLLTPQQLPATPESWKHDLYAYRRETIELLFQRLIQAWDLKVCPTKGLARTGTFVLTSVWLYQGLFLDNHRHHRPVAHIKEQLTKKNTLPLYWLLAR